MRVLFMGTPDFAVDSLQILLDRKAEVCAVFTQPDKPQGRKMILTPPPVKVLAQQAGIPVFQPVKMKDPQLHQQIRKLAPDVIVVVAYGRILPKEILEIPKWGCVNVHASLLPKYRGAGPIQWAVINGEAETGVTTMLMGEGLDTGDILLVEKTGIGAEETAGELFDRLKVIGANLLWETLCRMERGDLKPIPQQEDEASYAPILTKEMAALAFENPAETERHKIYGMNPWPVAYTMLEGKRLKVFGAVPVNASGEPGEILDPERFTVAFGEGALSFTEVQIEGAKRMRTEDFLRGRSLEKGQILPN